MAKRTTRVHAQATPIIGYTDYGVPIIAATPRQSGGLAFWCSHCAARHLHGRGDGHRVAHCWRDGSPFDATGYILREQTERTAQPA